MRNLLVLSSFTNKFGAGKIVLEHKILSIFGVLVHSIKLHQIFCSSPPFTNKTKSELPKFYQITNCSSKLFLMYLEVKSELPKLYQITKAFQIVLNVFGVKIRAAKSVVPDRKHIPNCSQCIWRYVCRALKICKEHFRKQNTHWVSRRKESTIFMLVNTA